MSTAPVVVEWIGAIAGIAGTLLIASNTPASKWGWPLWIVSSVSLMYVASLQGLAGVQTQQLVYTGFNLFGVWRWLIAPAIERSRQAASAEGAG